MPKSGLTRRATLVAGMSTMLLSSPMISRAASSKIVIVGGGFGGAATARTVMALMPSADVTLLTDQKQFWLCPGSNAVIAGLQPIEHIQVGFEGLKKRGINIVYDTAIGIDDNKREVRTQSGGIIPYDKLVLSPGVALDYSSIEGMTEADSQVIPHAWKAGPQSLILKQQLEAMPDDGLFIMSMPVAPYRCPPAPAERACLIAHYLKTHKPGARVLILDSKDEFPFQDLFTEAWEELYGDILEYRSIADDGLVRGIDLDSRTVLTDFDEIHGDVINIIPPQTAGRIAIEAGAADETGWCPVDVTTFASTLLKDVHVIGDAALVNALPKAGSTAASQGRVAAAALVADLVGEQPPTPNWIANCYSLAGPDYGIRLGATYILEDDYVVRNTTDFSVLDASENDKLADARYADVWLEQIKQELWG